MGQIPFDPRPGEHLTLAGQTFQVAAHPAAPFMAFSAEGRKATVYQIRNSHNGAFALKVFKKSFRSPDLLASREKLQALQNLPGLKAANRHVLTSADAIVRQFQDLEFAVLMPWLDGRTFFDLLLQAGKGTLVLNRNHALLLAQKFLAVNGALEARGMAHTDISSGNVMISWDMSGIELLDLEDLFAPEVAKPGSLNIGASGYRHPEADTNQAAHTWHARGDRYSAAILSAEILALAKPDLARSAEPEGFFLDHRLSAGGSRRYLAARSWLEEVAPAFGEVFDRAWLSRNLDSCPSLQELQDSLAKAAAGLSTAGTSPFAPVLPPIPPPARQAPPAAGPAPPVSWQGPSSIPPAAPTPGTAGATTSACGCCLAILITIFVLWWFLVAVLAELFP